MLLLLPAAEGPPPRARDRRSRSKTSQTCFRCARSAVGAGVGGATLSSPPIAHLQAARTTHVVASNILTLAQIQSDTLQSAPATTAVRSLLRDVVEQTRELTAAAAVDVSLHVAPSVPRLVCVDSFHLKQVWRGRGRGAHSCSFTRSSAPLWEQILIDGLAKTLRYASGTIYILVQRKRDVAEGGVRHTLVVEAFRKGMPSKAAAAAQSPEAVLESLGTGGPAPVGMRAHNVAQFLYTSRQIVQAMAGSVAVDELAGGLLRLTLSVPYTEPTDAEVEVRGRVDGAERLHAMPPPPAVTSSCSGRACRRSQSRTCPQPCRRRSWRSPRCAP